MSINVLAWKGYRNLFRELLPEEDGRPDPMSNINFPYDAVDAEEVVNEFRRNTESYHAVVLDREYLPLVQDRLDDLSKYINAREILKSALPLFNAPEYYDPNPQGRFIDDTPQMKLLPIRFGFNGAICNRHAENLLRDEGVLQWSSGSVCPSLDLFELLRLRERLGKGGLRVYRWSFNSPVELIVRRVWRMAKRDGYLGLPSFETFWRWIDDLDEVTLDEIIGGREWHDDIPLVILGPGENIATPLQRKAKKVTWHLVHGGGAVWLEGLGFRHGVLTKHDHDSDALNTLQNLIKALKARGFYACRSLGGSRADGVSNSRDFVYVGLPVLGWRGNEGSGARLALRELGFENKIEGFARGRRQMHVAISQFLDAAGLNGIGIALRGIVAPYDRGSLVDALALSIPPDERVALAVLKAQGGHLSPLRKKQPEETRAFEFVRESLPKPSNRKSVYEEYSNTGRNWSHLMWLLLGSPRCWHEQELKLDAECEICLEWYRFHLWWDDIVACLKSGKESLLKSLHDVLMVKNGMHERPGHLAIKAYWERNMISRKLDYEKPAFEEEEGLCQTCLKAWFQPPM